ncbi:TPA: YadA-like family protein [Stenotrophomonas maltophilia]|nr:YadA-like family protein [Stenotrophomonas maltophilia]
MNRIYRRLWSKARQCWVVASELAHCEGKSTKQRLTFSSVLIGAGLLAGGTNSAHAAIFLGCGTNESGIVRCAPFQGHDTVSSAGSSFASNFYFVMGAGAYVDGNYATVFGNRARGLGDRTSVFGYGAEALKGYSTVVGAYAQGNGIGTTVLGNDAKAYSQNSIAVGSGARTVESSAGVSRIAIGGNAFAGSAGYSGAVALGGNARAEYNGVAVGHHAKALAVGSVALGLNSEATESNSVSVGSSSTKRRVVNVADARLSTTSTDAVTGKQLHATNQNVTAATNTANAAKTTADQALVNTRLVTQTSASSAVRVGGDNTGTQLDIRNRSNASRKLTGVADATLSTTSTEAVTGKQLHATNTAVTTAQTTATAAKTAADNALGQVTTVAGLVGQVSASGNVRLGAQNTGTVLDVANKNGTARRISNVASATLSASSTDAVTGQQLHATNTAVTTAQSTATAAKTTADNALGQVTTVAGLVGQVSASGQVRLGAENTGTVMDVSNKNGARRRIQNIANGILGASSTDAVTGQQLFATNERVGSAEARNEAQELQLVDHADRLADHRVDLDRLRADFDGFEPDLEGVVKFNAERTLVDLEGAVVKGVGPGDISSAASTDAVNGGQLFATNARIEQMEQGSRFLQVGYDEFSEDASAGWLGVAIGDSAESSPTGEGGTAVGSFSKAFGTNSVALGRASFVEAAAMEGFALGASSHVQASGGIALGARSVVEAGADGSVALGHASIADEMNTVSVGTKGRQRRIVNVDRGYAENDVVTVAQLRESLATLGGGASLDANGNIIAPTYAIQGGNHNTVGDALAALDGAVVVTNARVGSLEGKLRSAFQGATTLADGLNQVTMSGAQGAVLTNLADGRIAAGSRDAVTGSQLHDAKQEIARNRSDLDALRDSQVTGNDLARLSVAETESAIDFGGATLTGVADAELSASSREAVTGRQLHNSNSRIGRLETALDFVSIDGGEESSPAVAGLYGVSIGSFAEASPDGEGATAIGSYARARASGSVALGRGSFVDESARGGIAISTGANVYAAAGVALGNYTQIDKGADGAVALGAYSVAAESDVVSIGNATLKRRIVNVANGRNAQDATTVTQLNATLATLGGGAHIDSNGNIIGPHFTVQGQQQSTLNDALQSLDGAVTTQGSRVEQVETQLRSVFQDTTTRSDGLNQLTLAGAQGMVISNVANGLVAAGSRDAVNGGQLHDVQQQLNGRMDGLEQRIDGQPQARVAANAAGAPEAPTPPAETPTVADTGKAPNATPETPKEPTPQVDTADLEKMLARANEYSDGISREVDRRLDKMDKRFNRMAAMSSAQSAMAMNTAGLNTYNRLGAGVGYSDGESAMAVGYQRVLNEKGSATFSLNGAFTNSGERSMGVGVGIGW